MIFYFSATGNCKYVAISLAKKDEKVYSIADLMKKKEFSYNILEGEHVGIISPTYNLGLPLIVNEFLANLKLKYIDKPYIYFVATYGTSPGQSGLYANKHMEKNGFNIDAFYSVKMPDTWTPTFNLTNKDKIARTNEKAEVEIEEICKHVQNKDTGDYMKAKLPKFIVKLYNPTYDKNRKTENLHVEDSCIGCGLCAKICPVEAIEIKNGKPVWIKEQCLICLGCLHRCPKFAIQYKKSTKKHGQYVNPNVRL